MYRYMKGFFILFKMFEWDNDNVIITGSSDGIVRVSLPVGLFFLD